MKEQFFLLILALIGMGPVEGVKILVFVPGWSNSHMLFNYRFSAALTARGHSMTLWNMLDSTLNNTNLNPPPGVEEFRVVIDLPSRNMTGGLSAMDEFVFKDLGMKDYAVITKNFRERFRAACEMQMEREDLIQELSGRGFDLVLSHGFDNCPVVLTHLMGLSEKFTYLTPGAFILDTMAQVFGLPLAPSYIPNAMRSSSDHMNFSERLKNTFFLFLSPVFRNLFGDLIQDEEDLLRDHPNQDRPPFSQLLQNIPSIFVNGEPFLDFPRPFPYGVSYLGELGEQTRKTEKQPRKLGQNFIDILERSEKGTIIFSLGTIAKAKYMPDHLRKSFANAFAALEGYQVIWRFDGEVPEAKGVDHLHIVKWFPQRDLLNHPKIKLFVTHGGFNSLLEATKAGVPLVMVPLFFDQHGNGARAQRHGLGLVIEKTEVTKESMLEAITTVLGNEQYRIKAKKLARTLKDKLVDPGDLLEHRVQFLAKRRSHFPSLVKANTKSFIEYQCLDVIAVFLSIIATFLWFVWKLLLCCLRIFNESGKKTNSRKMKKKQ